MEQRYSIGRGESPERQNGARRSAKTLCSLCGVQPAAGGPDALMGEPLCKGPVCRLCYETKVLPARRRSEPSSETQAARGAWALRTPERKLVMGTLRDGLRAAVDELVTGMMDNGYFGMAQSMDAVEELIGALTATAVPGRPLAVEAFGRSYEVPWYGPALLAGPRSVVPVMLRQDLKGEASAQACRALMEDAVRHLRTDAVGEVLMLRPESLPAGVIEEMDRQYGRALGAIEDYAWAARDLLGGGAQSIGALRAGLRLLVRQTEEQA